MLLVDEPDPGARTVQLRPPRRRRELLLLAAAVVVVVGVGLVGDDNDDTRSTPTTTTSRRVRSAADDGGMRPGLDVARAAPTTRRARSGASSGPPTSWPQFEAGSGPHLPGPVTGAHLGLVTSDSQVVIIDLDTGDRCRGAKYGNGVWLPPSLPTPGRMFVQNDQQFVAVDARCSTTVLPIRPDGSFPAAWTDHSAWFQSGTSDQRLVELALDTGEPTGREVALPRFNGVHAVAIGDDLVLAAAGQMTFIDPDADERRDLGVGNPLAAYGSLLAYIECPELRCRLGLLDVASGDRRVIEGLEPVEWEPGQFAPDGGHVRVAASRALDDEPITAIVDVRTGSVRYLDISLFNASFTPDGQWLIGLDDGRVTAVKVDGSTPNIEITPDLSRVQNLALL